MEKTIDIIIPVYKAHDTLFSCLASIAMQTIAPKIQVTLVNDQCPEGDYTDIIQRFDGYLSIQELMLEHNVGPGDARQYGIEHTTCPFIFFVDADDVLLTTRAIEDLYNDLINNPNTWMIMGRTVEEMPDGEWMPLPMPNSIWIFGKCYRRSILEKYNIRFKPGSRSNEDVGFNTLLTILSSAHQDAVRAYNKVIYLWRYKEDSITRIDDSMYTYLDGPVGWVDNLIHAYSTAMSMGDDVQIEAIPLYNMIAGWCAESWILYNNIYHWKPDMCKRNWPLFVKLYNDTARPHIEQMTATEWQAGLNSINDQGLGAIEKHITFKDYMQALHNSIDFLDISQYEEPNAS